MEITKKNKSGPVFSKQKEILIEFITAKKQMYTGKLSPSYTREKMQKNWVELANMLNSILEGPAKDWKHWRKTWVDLKKNTKSKFIEQKKYAEGTGGGPPLPPTDGEIKLLNIISPVAISGQFSCASAIQCYTIEQRKRPNITESEAVFDFEENETVVEDGEFIYNDDGLQQNEEDINFHDYASPSTSKENVTPKRKAVSDRTPVTTNRKRSSKISRLQDALKCNDKFVKISADNIEAQKTFHVKRIELMESKLRNQQSYYEKKLATLQMIANAATQLAADVTDIKNNIL